MIGAKLNRNPLWPAARTLTAVLLFSLAADAAEAPNLPPPPPGMFAPPGRAITHVKGDVYRANNGGWYVAILDTPDGLLLVDTLSVPFAKWLKEELAKKFPGKQVRYVVLSHSHWDHTEGGKVFADTAKFIAQEGFLRNMDGASPAEFFADTPRPDIVYSERMTLRFGGKTIEMVFPGKNHANDGTAVLFTDERVLFTTDFPADALVLDTMRSLPSACGPFDGHSMDEWIRSYRTLEALDFDISVGGHGCVPITKRDVAEGREFMEYLKREVQAAMSKGLSLEQMKQSIRLEPYKDWRHYEQLRVPNIEAAYYNLKTYK